MDRPFLRRRRHVRAARRTALAGSRASIRRGRGVAAALRERLAAQPDGPAVGDRLAQVLGVGEALASDASWAVRRLLEVLASERPLVVVLEDVHWAETPMLDLADAVVERVHGPVLFLCLCEARAPRTASHLGGWEATGNHHDASPLTPEDARLVAEHLLGPQAPILVVDRVCDTAEGNPLYLEQLTAMLADQGLLANGRWVGSGDADVEIPVTLQALLAARLDRLDPVPRLILERASVEGRRFRIAALRALAPEVSPDEVESAIASLERKGLLQPEDEAGGRWRFAHALVLEAAYRGLSKELRADLHERLADWMIEEDADQPDVDESVARHLERALHLREELGARDERSAALSERAGQLFANAGSRAFAAVDFITARDLLGRAAALLPERSPRRLDLLANLGAALADSGRTEEAETLLSEAEEQARAAGFERDALRASVQLLVNRIYRSPTEAEIESAVIEARAAADAFEVLDDDVGLAEAALAISYLEETRGRIAEARLWVSSAFRHALAAGHPREARQAAGDLVGFAIFGPLPFDRFAADAEELLSLGEPISGSVAHALMAAAALAVGDDLRVPRARGTMAGRSRPPRAGMVRSYPWSVDRLRRDIRGQGRGSRAEAPGCAGVPRDDRQHLVGRPGRRIPVRGGQSAGSAARSSSGSPMRSRRPSRSPIGVPSSDANCCSRGRTCSVGPRSRRRPPRGARSSSWSPPTT